VLTFARTLRRTYDLLGRPRPGRWVLLVVLALVVAGFEAAGAVLIYALMGLVSGETGALELPLVGDLTVVFPDVPLRTLQLALAAVVAAFFLVRSGVIVGQMYVQARIVHNAGARLSSHLLRGYLAMPYLAHTQLNSAELVRNAFDSVQNLVTQVMKPAVEVVAESILVLGLTTVLLVVAPEATLVALAVLGPTVWLLQSVVQPKLKRLGRESQASRQGTLQAMQQALGGLRDIRLLGREDAFARVFTVQRRIMSRTDYVRTALSEVPQSVIETALVIVIVAVFVLAVVSGDGLGSLVSTLGLFAYAGLRLQPSLRRIVRGLNHVRFGSAIVDDLLHDRRRVDAVLAVQADRPTGPAGLDRLGRGIELRGVSFTYAPGAMPALHDVDLVIRRGEFIGICGPTGGGKSTLVDLIAGLLQPTEGQVTVDGRVLEDRPEWWYAQLGVVSQSPYLIDDTMRANIAFGRGPDDVDEVLLERSVERAQLWDVVAGLPEGLDTLVGERGVRLSGGQRQRVAIARALYREPSVIIFDEGTSALDAGTEAALVEAVDELKIGRTLISVAHRVSTVRRADRIVVVQGGRIAAEGSYGQLLAASELFRRLAR
jgi:ATP-binding cassette, subfamily B, bacterial PglK